MKLTQSQRTILASACADKEGFAARPNTLNAGQLQKITSALVDKGLVKEIRAKSGIPVWREDEQGRGLALKILKPGREAIALSQADDALQTAQPDPANDASGSRSPARKGSTQHSKRVDDHSQLDDREGTCALPRAGSKKALVIGMLREESGATLDALVAATGWLPHTTRAALTGLRKKGFAIARERPDGLPSIYRIIGEPLVPAV